MKELTDATTKSIRAQGDAAEEARDKEINALSQRIKENKELADVYRTLAVAQLAAGEAEEQKIINEQRKLTRLTRHVLPSEFGAHPLDEKPAAFDKRRDEEILKIIDQANQKRKDGIKLSSKEHKLLESVAKLAKLRATNKSNEIRIQEFDKLEATPTDVDVDGGPDLEALEKYRKSEEKIEADLRKARALGAEQEIERANEKLEIIKRTIELIKQGSTGSQALRIARDEIDPKKPVETTTKNVTISSDSEDDKLAVDAFEKQIDQQIARIKKIGETELDQIREIKEARIKAIDEYAKRAGVSDDEIQSLRRKADQEEQDALDELKRSEDRARLDELGFIAEIEATTARMNGRSLKATQIELSLIHISEPTRPY